MSSRFGMKAQHTRFVQSQNEIKYEIEANQIAYQFLNM